MSVSTINEYHAWRKRPTSQAQETEGLIENFTQGVHLADDQCNVTLGGAEAGADSGRNGQEGAEGVLETCAS